MNDTKKPICKLCDSPYHYKTFCPLNRKKIKVKKYNPEEDAWAITRLEWFKKNASHDGYYYCHYCGKPMTMQEATLDHKKNRSNHKNLVHDMSNLLVACWPCNTLKGSQSYERFCERYYPELLS